LILVQASTVPKKSNRVQSVSSCIGKRTGSR
jgi:hypothetical protein